MDTKVIAIIIAAVVVVGGASAFVILNDDGKDLEDSKYNIISRVNAEGSGIYIKTSLVNYVDGMPYRNATPFFTIVDDVWTVSSANANAWKGLVFGTPGVSTIQHTQLASLANDMGLDFKAYSVGQKIEDAIYYDPSVFNFTKVDPSIHSGGILWEPQHQIIIKDGTYSELALTNDIFPGHTCCIIAGNVNYMSKNMETTEKFLKGYMKSVDDINTIIKDTSSQEYNDFIDFVVSNVTSFKDEKGNPIDGAYDMAKAAVSNINYLYADDETGSLSVLKTSIADLVSDLSNIGGAFNKKIKDPADFANKFVDDKYLKSAVSKVYTGANKETISVSVISGDIHQIALHWGISEGYFSELGITVEVNSELNGAGVSTAMENGTTDFGFLGAPPATIRTINGGYITA